MIGVPSYKGPHVHCWDAQLEFMFKLGRLAQRSEQGLEDVKFVFGLASQCGNSLIGQARDIIVDRALAWNADYVLFFDDDMKFDDDVFIRLWKHQKPFVGALAFTSREPIAPVLYKFVKSFDWSRQVEQIDIDVIFDYPKNQLFRVDAIGTGVVLIETSIFRKLEKPWFHGAVSAGEDIHLCWKMGRAGIPIYCDTSIKTSHAPNEPLRWHDEAYYLESIEKAKAFHEARKAADDRHPQFSELAPTG